MAAVIKFADWVLSAETATGAPSGIYFAECLTCEGRSTLVDNDRSPVEVWALQHTFLNPEHQQYRFITQKFWRVDPLPGNPRHIRRLGSTST